MPDRKSTRLNSSHTVIYTLSLHDALPISWSPTILSSTCWAGAPFLPRGLNMKSCQRMRSSIDARSEEHTSELQSHRDLHSFPTRRSSDLVVSDHPFEYLLGRRPILASGAEHEILPADALKH